MSRLSIFIFLFSIKALGQIYHHPPISERANHLFFEGYYLSALQTNQFQNNLLLSSHDQEQLALNFIVNSLRINEYGSEKRMATYLSDYAVNPLSKYIYFDLANYYFNIEKYPYALKWFSKVDANDVAKKHIPKYNFNKGYSYFVSKRYARAIPYLEKVKDDPVYESDAYYYLGHIAYQMEDFEKADRVFDLVSSEGQKADLNYFKADMNFRLGRFKKAIVAATIALEQTYNEREISELSKIIGESYFNLSEYDKAIPFLEDYTGVNGKWKNIDFYQLGFVYYKNQEYTTAISHFNKIIGNNDKFAQYANYYLAECYLKIDDKTAAFNAFRSASKMNFVPEISEDALLNYAKLSYEIGNPYESTPKVLFRFIEKYPNNDQQNTVSELLVNSYMKRGNYDAALGVLEGKNSYRNNRILQKISYLKAINLFQSGNYERAIPFFKKSIKAGKNFNFKAAATYWLGHANYELNRFDMALNNFIEFKKIPINNTPTEFKNIDYDMGYAYFKKGDYTKALASFENFLSQGLTLNATYQRDVYLRIGDCNFALKKYWPAMDNYDKAVTLDPKKAAYALYQKGISYGFVDRNDQKINTLNTLVSQLPNASYTDDALFELASAYTVSKNDKQAISAYDKLLINFKQSPYHPKAWLSKGLILYNQESYDEAEKVLKKLVVNYKNDVVVQQAVITLKEIAVDQGNVQAFSQWLEGQEIKIFTDSEIEETAFLAAEKQYLENNKTKAIKLLSSYLDDYPNGINRLNATYFLAEIFYENKNYTLAEEKYKEITSTPINEYSEKSLVRLIEILKLTGLYGEALPYLIALDGLAEFEENKRFAQFNLMQVYYVLKDYPKAIVTAEGVLQLAELDDLIKWDAFLILARSYWIQNDLKSAEATFEKLENAPDDELAAEALYFKAKKQFSSGAFEASNETIFIIAEKSDASGKWGPKALILLSNNYRALGDIFQATYILESIIENFSQYSDIVVEAQDMLINIKQEASKKNASIIDQSNEI